jgi:hypothetical protein
MFGKQRYLSEICSEPIATRGHLIIESLFILKFFFTYREESVTLLPEAESFARI